MNYRKMILIGSIFGVIAVGLGAFGAHGLKNLIPIEKLATFKTGVTYQFYHSIAILCVAMFFNTSPSKWLKWSSICFMLGIFLFSGSLYLLASREIIGLSSYKWLGPLTPIGGLFFIMGWVTLAISAIKNNDKNAAQ